MIGVLRDTPTHMFLTLEHWLAKFLIIGAEGEDKAPFGENKIRKILGKSRNSWKVATQEPVD